ncbi:MAG: O-antigen ligase family protein [Patescibacteria group bacterium]|jgi:O-antigen ligase
MKVKREAVLPIVLGFAFFVTNTFAGDSTPWVEGFLGILTILLLLFSRQNLGFGQDWFSPWRWFLILIVFFSLTVPFAGDKYQALRTWIYWFISAVFFLSAWSIDRQYRKKMLLIMVWIAGAGSLWAIVNFISVPGLDRAGGFFKNANALGGYCVLTLPLAIALIFETKRLTRISILISSVSIAISLILSFSVTGFVALVGVLIFVLVIWRKNIKRKWFLLTGGVIIGLIVVGVGIRFFQTHSFKTAVRLDKIISQTHFKSSFTQRWQFNAVAFAMFKKHPIVGIGLGNYQQAFSQYANSRLEQPRYVHNAYLEIFTETGILGGLAFLIIIISLATATVRTYQKSEIDKILIFGAGMGLLASALNAFVDFGWHFPGIWVGFWIISGLVLLPVQNKATPLKSGLIASLFIILGGLVLIRGLGVVASYTYFARAERLVEQGEDQQAIPNFQKGLKYDPDPVRMTNLATSLWLRHNSQADALIRAEEQVNQALKWSKINYTTYLVQARIALANKDYAKTRISYEKMLEIDRHFHPDATAEFVNFLRFQKDFTKADAIVKEAEKAYKDILKPGESLFKRL